MLRTNVVRANPANPSGPGSAGFHPLRLDSAGSSASGGRAPGTDPDSMVLLLSQRCESSPDPSRTYPKVESCNPHDVDGPKTPARVEFSARQPGLRGQTVKTTRQKMPAATQ